MPKICFSGEKRPTWHSTGEEGDRQPREPRKPYRLLVLQKALMEWVSFEFIFFIIIVTGIIFVSIPPVLRKENIMVSMLRGRLAPCAVAALLFAHGEPRSVQ